MSVPLMKGHLQCRDTCLDTGEFVEEGNYCIIFFYLQWPNNNTSKQISKDVYIYIYQNNKCYVEVLHVTIMLVV